LTARRSVKWIVQRRSHSPARLAAVRSTSSRFQKCSAGRPLGWRGAAPPSRKNTVWAETTTKDPADPATAGGVAAALGAPRASDEQLEESLGCPYRRPIAHRSASEAQSSRAPRAAREPAAACTHTQYSCTECAQVQSQRSSPSPPSTACHGPCRP
jgi:hypothetical protein